MAITLLALISPASAADLPGPPLQMQVSGTAYQGVPEFAVYADGVLVGGGIVRTAYDVEQGEPINSMHPARELLDAHSEFFYFNLPGADPKSLEIVFTNDHWAGEDEPHLDRNLFILSVVLDGEPIDLNRFRVPHGANFIEGDVIALYHGTRVVLEREGEDASR